jgi:hypothetical protein
MLRLHFGLGRATVAERVEVRWPSGRVTVLNNATAKQRLVMSESGKVDKLPPHPP